MQTLLCLPVQEYLVGSFGLLCLFSHLPAELSYSPVPLAQVANRLSFLAQGRALSIAKSAVFIYMFFGFFFF